MEQVILGLGSNRGNSIAILHEAVQFLRQVLTDCAVSSVYKTAPQDYFAQADFYNIAVGGRYSGTPWQLLQQTQFIEARLGRNRHNEIAKGPRTLDIDIIFFGKQSVCDAQLVIPHERYAQRAFVLTPVVELCPQYRDPITGQYLAHLLQELPDQGVVKRCVWKDFYE